MGMACVVCKEDRGTKSLIDNKVLGTAFHQVYNIVPKKPDHVVCESHAKELHGLRRKRDDLSQSRKLLLTKEKEYAGMFENLIKTKERKTKQNKENKKIKVRSVI